MKKLILFFAISLIAFNCYAAEADVIAELTEKDLPALNEQLRRLQIETQIKNTGWLDMYSKKIKNCATPTETTDAANKAYVDAMVSDTAYGASWDTVTTIAPSKNAVYDKINSLSDANTSNVIFSWNGCEYAGVGYEGFMDGVSTLTVLDVVAGGYSYVKVKGSTLQTIFTSKFKKIAGISTVTVWGKIWAYDNNATREAQLKVDIGGQSVTITSVASSTPTWYSGTIDVSGLTDGTTYDITIQLGNEATLQYGYCIGIILIGS